MVGGFISSIAAKPVRRGGGGWFVPWKGVVDWGQIGGSVGALRRWVGQGNRVGMRKLKDRKCWENGFSSRSMLTRYQRTRLRKKYVWRVVAVS